MNILSQYYRGITQQLRSEVDFINSLFHHQGEKGSGNEAAIRDLLKKFIAKRYGVGTGIVIDRHGNQSRQCDIVIYDTFLYPSILAMSSVHLFPVDIVYATIEVKTTLDSQKAKDAIQNIASVKNLDYIKGNFAAYESQGGDCVLSIKKTTPPVGFVFAYNSSTLNDETFENWFNPASPEEQAIYPSLIGCLDMGMVGFAFDADPCCFALFPDAGMKPRCMVFPVVQPEADDPDKMPFLKVSRALEEGEFFQYEGTSCPVKKIGMNYMAIDQSRVLLNFLLMMNDLISLKKISPELQLREYLKNSEKFYFTKS